MEIHIDAQEVEQVQQFKYMGSIIAEDGCCEQDLKSRIAMGKNAFMTKKTLLTGRMDLKLRKNGEMHGVALYGAETRTMTQNHRRNLEAFEMWIWRKMLKISWTQKISNQLVLDSLKKEKGRKNPACIKESTSEVRNALGRKVNEIRKKLGLVLDQVTL